MAPQEPLSSVVVLVPQGGSTGINTQASGLLKSSDFRLYPSGTAGGSHPLLMYTKVPSGILWGLGIPQLPLLALGAFFHPYLRGFPPIGACGYDAAIATSGPTSDV